MVLQIQTFWCSANNSTSRNDSLLQLIFEENTSSKVQLSAFKSLNWKTLYLDSDSFNLVVDMGISAAEKSNEMRFKAKLELLKIRYGISDRDQQLTQLSSYNQRVKVKEWDSLYLMGKYVEARILEIKDELPAAEELLLNILNTEKSGFKKFPKVEAVYYEELGILAQYKGDLNLELKMYQKALEINERLQDSIGMSSNFTNIGGAYFAMRETQRALFYHKKALDLARATGFTQNETSCYVNIASLYGFSGKFDSCLTYAIQAEQLATAHGYIDDIINSSDIIAACYVNLNQAERALPYQLKAYELESIPYQKSILALNVGLNYIELENYDKAEAYYKSAMEHLDGYSFDREIQNILAHQGHLYLVWQKWNQAQQAFDQAEQMIDLVDDYYLSSEIYRGQAELLNQMGDNGKSNQYVNQAIPLISDYSKLAKLYRIKAENHQILQEYEASLSAYSTHILYQDSAQQQSDQRLEQSILAKFGVEKAENEARLATQEKEIIGLKLKQEQRVKLFGFVLLGLSILSIILIIGRHRRYIAEKETTAKLEQEAAERVINHSREILKNQSELIIDKNRIIDELKSNLDLFFEGIKASPEGLNAFLEHRILTNDDWDKFKVSFEVVYPGFIAASQNQFKDLSSNELRLLCLHRLGMNRNEIADMLAVLPSSVKRSVNRFYQKYELDHQEDMHSLAKRILS